MKKIYTLLTLIGLVTFSESFSQDKKGINFHLRKAIAENEKSNKNLNLMVKGSSQRIAGFVSANGGTFKYNIGSISSISLPATKVSEFISHAEKFGIERIEYTPAKGEALNDTMLINNNVDSVHLGLGDLPQAYDGAGIILGFVDTGIDFDHDDFKDETGKSRILYIWDQTQSSGAPVPQPYNYGIEWTSADIDGGSCTHNPTAYNGHGSAVSGIAAGNGLAVGKYKGIAPKAEIIMVASDFNASNWTQTVADGVNYIFTKADAIGKPCVINLSLGTSYGSRDGKDLAAQAIDSMMQAKPGRVVTASVANSGNVKYHLGYNVSADTSFTWFNYNSSETVGGAFPGGTVFFELWADTADFGNVNFSVGADLASPTYNFRGQSDFVNIKDRLNGIFANPISNSGGDLLGTLYTWAEEIEGVYFMQVIVEVDSTSSDYRWRFSTTGTGKFDVWAKNSLLGFGSDMFTSIPDEITFPPIARYKMPDFNKTLYSSWISSPNVITVGSYQNRASYEDVNNTIQTVSPQVGSINPTSSLGPNRQGVIKPDIATPGSTVMSVKPAGVTYSAGETGVGGQHRIGSGSSAAAPMIAGIAALYLQKCPNSTYTDFRTALFNTAKQDVFTGGTPNNTFGYGKADALSALETSSYSVVLSNSGNNQFCEGDSVTLSAPGGYTTYLWSNSSSNSSVVINQSSSSSIEVTNGQGCLGRSDTLNIAVLPNPVANITSDSMSVCENNDLILDADPTGGSGVYTNHLWSGDVAALSVVDTSVVILNAATSGIHNLLYTVTDANGCETSDSLIVTVNSNPTANMGVFPIFCINEEVQMDGVFTGTAPFSFSWDGDVNVLSDTAVSDPIFMSVSSGDFNLIFLVKDSNNCTASDNQTITVKGLPSVVISGGGNVCNGDSVEVNFTFTGNSPWDLNYSDGTNSFNVISNDSVLSLFSNSNSIYTTIDVMDLYCLNDSIQDSVGVMVFQIPNAPVAGSDSMYCSGDSLADLSAVSSLDGTLTWYSDAGLTTVLGNGSSITPSSVIGVTAYYITETNAICESDASVVEITVNSVPAAPETGNDTTYCESENMLDVIAVAGTGGLLTWYSDAGLTNLLGTGDSLSPSSNIGSNSYFVTETNNGCESGSSQVIVTVNANPAVPIIDHSGNTLTTNAVENSYQWFLNDNPISSGQSKDYEASADGIYYLLVTDANGCSSESDTLNFVFDGIEEKNAGISVKLYPNPFNGSFTIELNGFSENDINISVIDVIGKTVFFKQIKQKSDIAKYLVDISNEAKGVYFFRLADGNQVNVQKIINK